MSTLNPVREIWWESGSCGTKENHFPLTKSGIHFLKKFPTLLFLVIPSSGIKVFLFFYLNKFNINLRQIRDLINNLKKNLFFFFLFIQVWMKKNWDLTVMVCTRHWQQFFQMASLLNSHWWLKITWAWVPLFTTEIPWDFLKSVEKLAFKFLLL